MSLSINLTPIDPNPERFADTRPSYVIEFTKNLTLSDTFQAATRLLEELKVLNRQKLDPETRVSTLELYRKITLELSEDLEDDYANAPIPLSSLAQSHAMLAEALWLETGYGYKRALVDLKQKLISFKGNRLDALVILRALDALKNEMLVNYLTYTQPSTSIWSDLHKIYYHALQLSLEATMQEDTVLSNHKTINSVYSHTLLMHLANPQRLDKHSIRVISRYLGNLAKHAQLRGIGFIENPAGVFLVELDSNKPPVPYLKSRNVPSVETDILLVTIEVARNIYQHLSYIQENKASVSQPLSTSAFDVTDEDLLKHLIKFFGHTPTRAFSRIEKNQTAQVAIGMNEASILFRAQQRPKENPYHTWDVLNISANGYALKTFNSLAFSIAVGEIVCVRETGRQDWSLGFVVWLVNKTSYTEVGVKLLSASAETVELNFSDAVSNEPSYGLLLPEIRALQQPNSLLLARGLSKIGDQLEYVLDKQKFTIKIIALIDKSVNFERFEYNLIYHHLS